MDLQNNPIEEENTLNNITNNLEKLSLSKSHTHSKIASKDNSDFENFIRNKKTRDWKSKQKMLKTLYGESFVNHLKEEMIALSATSRLPGLKPSHFGLDIFLNNDEDIDFEDFFDGDDEIGPDRFDFAEQVEQEF